MEKYYFYRHKDIISVKYTALAPLYDSLMDHVDYGEWYTLISHVVEQFCNTEKPTVFEIGGGTGSLGKQLSLSGCNYTGSDYSFNMCIEAQKKELPYFCTDGKHLSLKKSFDLIIFLYDGINYLNTLDEYKKLFLEVWSNLNTDGLFLFDITTQANSLNYFLDTFDFQEISNTTLIRHSYFNTELFLQHNDFTLFSPVDSTKTLFIKQVENHIQRVFKASEIEQTIPLQLFNIIGIWDGFSMKKHTPRSERIHFLLKKIEL